MPKKKTVKEFQQPTVETKPKKRDELIKFIAIENSPEHFEIKLGDQSLGQLHYEPLDGQENWNVYYGPDGVSNVGNDTFPDSVRWCDDYLLDNIRREWS